MRLLNCLLRGLRTPATGWAARTLGLAALALLPACRSLSPPAAPPPLPWHAAASVTTGWVHLEAEAADLPLPAAAATAERLAALLAPLSASVVSTPVTVHWYATRAAYTATAQDWGQRGADGGAINLSSGEIALPPPTATGAWRAALAHELTHWYLNQVGDFAPPGQPPGTRWPAVPWWLQEGLATYAEAAALAPPGAAFPPVNADRLRELQSRLRAHRCPPVAALLSQPLARSGNSTAYAVAWGLTFDLLHPGGQPAPQWPALRAFLAASQAGYPAAADHPGVPPPTVDTAAAAWCASAAPVMTARANALLAPAASPAAERAWQSHLLRLKVPVARAAPGDR